MPTIGHEFRRMVSAMNGARRRRRRGRCQRCARRSCGSRSLMIETLSMIMIRVGIEPQLDGGVRKIWRCAARQQNANRRNTNDRGATQSQPLVALPDGPEKRHVHPTYNWMIVPPFWLAGDKISCPVAASERGGELERSHLSPPARTLRVAMVCVKFFLIGQSRSIRMACR
jgi:hypothetical protein